jgi:hypothetical protein
VGSCTASRLVPFGTIQTSQTQIGYSGGAVSVTAAHKVDVDVIEDGCVSRLELTVSLPKGQCPLKLVFTGKNATYGGLTEARFTADSTCPGFLDAAEGTYTSLASFGPWRYLGPQVVPQRMASSVCMAPVRLGFPDKTFRLYRTTPSPAELTVNLQGLELHGELFSRGDPSVQCFDATACGPGLHDGGDGWCVAEGKCSPGYHDGGDGRCVASSSCAPGYYLSPGGACTPWQSTTPLPGTRRGASSVATGGYLYVVGGNDGNLLDEVWFAPLLSEGGLGEWRATTPLPSGRYDAPVVASGGYLYVVGGEVSDCSGGCTTQAKEVLKAPIQADGTLGAWSVAGTLPDLFRGHAVVSHGSTLYVLGGGVFSTWARATLLAPLQSDGNLAAWKNGPALPTTLQGHAAIAVGNTLYVVSGFSSSSGGSQIYRSPLAADGSLGGSWIVSGLPYECGYHTVETHDGYLYILGGRCETSISSYQGHLLQYAPVLSSGALGTWTAQPVLDPERMSHRSAVHGEYMYLLGGTDLSNQWVAHHQMARFRPSGGGVGP